MGSIPLHHHSGDLLRRRPAAAAERRQGREPAAEGEGGDAAVPPTAPVDSQAAAPARYCDWDDPLALLLPSRCGGQQGHGGQQLPLEEGQGGRHHPELRIKGQ